MKHATKVVTGEVRLNYINLEECKFSLTIIIPKEANETMAKIYTGMSNATKNGLDIWGGEVPEDLITCLKDGDLLEREEYKGCFYINATSRIKPQIVDRNLKEISINELYNGCYGRVSLNFFPYNHLESGNCGIGAGLLNIQKLRDGDYISNRSSALDDFDIVKEDSILI